MDIKDSQNLASKRPSGARATLDTNSGVATAGANEAGDTKSEKPGIPDVGKDGNWLPS